MGEERSAFSGPPRPIASFTTTMSSSSAVGTLQAPGQAESHSPQQPRPREQLAGCFLQASAAPSALCAGPARLGQSILHRVRVPRRPPAATRANGRHLCPPLAPVAGVPSFGRRCDQDTLGATTQPPSTQLPRSMWGCHELRQPWRHRLQVLTPADASTAAAST